LATNSVALELLADEPEPLVVPCPRRPGQKEARWMHLVCGRPEEADEAYSVPEPRSRPAGSSVSELAARVEQLEARLERLEQEMAALLPGRNQGGGQTRDGLQG
jgi:uncharacterized protein YceH (UPF0502 family)